MTTALRKNVKARKRHNTIGVLCLFACVFFLPLATCADGAEKLAIIRGHFEIGAHFYDYQNYHGVPYFHGGIDICADAGTEVITPVSGLVEVFDYKITASADPHVFSYDRKRFKRGDISQTRYLEVAITEKNGQKWMFRHIDPKSIPDAIFNAAERRTAVAGGSVIGKVARWLQPVLPEQRLYNHVHLEIIDADGYYLNPTSFIRTTKDYYPPQLHALYAATHGTLKAIEIDSRGSTVLSGNIDLIGAVTDRMNRAAYQHSIYAADWAIDRLDETASYAARIEEHPVFRFDRLPFRGERIQLSKVIFRDHLMIGSTKIQANGSSGPRFFLINFSSGTPATGYSAHKSFDTSRYPNGKYLLRINIEDSAGNRRPNTFQITIKN